MTVRSAIAQVLGVPIESVGDPRSGVSDATGFDHGDLFESEAQVREYFTVAEQAVMFGEDGITDQAILDAFADAVIEHRWHMEACTVCDRTGQYTAATQTLDDQPLCDQCAEEHARAYGPGGALEGTRPSR